MRLLVILAGPPLTSGRRTQARVGSLPDVLPCASVVMVNLCETSAPDLPALSDLGKGSDGWLQARQKIAVALAECDELMAAWGLSNLAGQARQHRRSQLEWLVQTAADLGLDQAWTVGGEPRHPSRWHQYVSDVHGRTAGGTVVERLRQVVVRVPLSDLV